MKISNLTGILLVVMTINVSQANDLHDRDAFKRPEGIPSPPANPLTVDKAALGKTLFLTAACHEIRTCPVPLVMHQTNAGVMAARLRWVLNTSATPDAHQPC